ncbi:MCE family protein [Streptomyces sp. NPDC046805]|uniref:MCE family protein n=1 Tax=Streptomyces sp. NPDC046805 TaxID=3155134 RepID=UPI0033C53BB4
MSTRSGAFARARTAVLWAAAGSVLLTACEFNGLQDVQLPGGAAADGNAYHVTVEFRDVLDLVSQSAVKVDNVTVGAVENVRLDGWHARVRMRISNDVKLPANAIAEIGQTSMLGEKYVALSAPPDAQPVGRLRDGAKIPLSRSGRNAEIEEVLSALSALLNGGGVAQLKTISVELNKALGGREDRVKDLLKQLDTFIGGLDEQRDDIVRALTGVDRLAKRLRTEKDTIGQAVDTIPPALKVLADQRRKLTTMLASLDALGATGTKVINASRSDTIANLRNLTPILTRLDEAGDDLPNALELLTTYPFPRNVTDTIHGDYVNLHATADLDLAGLYRNLGGGQQSKPGGALPEPPGIPGVPGLPEVPKLPKLPKAPGMPGLDPPDDSGGSGSSKDGGGGLLCPPLCTGSYAAYHGSAGEAGPTGPSYGSGVDPTLVDLLLKGMRP